MKTTSYFNEALFHEPDPTTDQLFEQKAPILFDLGSKTSFLRFHAQLAFHNDPMWPGPLPCGGLGHTEAAAMKDSNEDYRKPGIFVDCVPYEPSSPPPKYFGSPGLSCRTISEPGELRAALHAVDQEEASYVYSLAKATADQKIMKSFQLRSFICGNNPTLGLRRRLHRLKLHTTVAFL